ncbi:SRPBCC domain-containing protein [Actinoallomurus sp. NPDC050550]|uniref:SRPBCC domain-containing protein n=1 Tax=Actinoallomurus sp. NPDC050550 TaxID=3154937 RepID=UPI0034093D96
MDPRTFRTRTTLHTTDDGTPMLRFEHAYGHAPERVWRAITDGEQHSIWFGFPVAVEPVVGGRFSVTFSPEMVEEGRVQVVDEPRLFVYTGRGDVYRWTLTPDGDGCRVVMENELGDPGHMPYSAAGFHLSLDGMDEMLGQEAGRPAARDGKLEFDDLVAHYSTLREESA